jgi:hypothetical protein
MVCLQIEFAILALFHLDRDRIGSDQNGVVAVLTEPLASGAAVLLRLTNLAGSELRDIVAVTPSIVVQRPVCSRRNVGAGKF